jgi:Tfp pilus assembly protein FimT
MPAKKTAAFTLRELLVLLAIVGIVVMLATLAVPNITGGPGYAYSSRMRPI